MSAPSALVLAAYDPNDVRPGWIALVLVVALAVATYLLWRSMNKQLRRIDAPTREEVRDRGNDGERHPLDDTEGG